MASRNPSKPKSGEVVDTIISVHRCDLSYGFRSQPYGDVPREPLRRHLALMGTVVFAERKLVGLSARIDAYGRDVAGVGAAKDELPSVGFIEMRQRAVHVALWIPGECIHVLSSGFHDGRLGVVYGRGACLFRGSASWSSVDFHSRRGFEDYWGESIPAWVDPV